jgi:uncharacterized protein YjbK
MENFEYEERVLLSFDQYQNILKKYIALFPTQYRFIKNINTYLDDENHTLINNHQMLRIRKIDDSKEELTLKIKKENGDLEINETLLDHPTIDKHLLIPFNKLKPIITLETQRVEIDVEDYLIAIDMNAYNGIIDFNLEIEASSKERAKEIILQFCKEFSLEYKNAYPSKSRRAFASIKN